MRFVFGFLLLSLLSVVTQAAESISVQLLWKHQFQFAGYYIAKEKGFYAEEGLEVGLKEYGPDLDLVDEVLQGNSQFAVGRTSLLIDQNAGADIVALFAAYQQSPLMLLTRKDSGILLSSDLRNRRVMITNDAKRVGELIAMLLQAGITLSEFEQVEHSYDVNDLISGKVDAIASYVSNEPFEMERQGVEYNVIHPKDYGFDMYSDILFSSREYIEQHPDTTDKFYRASIRGWIYAFNHIEETARLIFERYNTQNKSLAALIFEGQELKKLAFDKDGNFGTLSETKFNEMAQVYLVTGSIFRGYNFSDFIYRPPSNQFRLSMAEKRFIRNTTPLRVCVNPDWYPFESYDEAQHQGMIADYLALVMNNLELEYQVVPSTSWSGSMQLLRSGQCQMLAGAMQTINRAGFMDFSRPYLSVPAVVAMRQGEEGKKLSEMTLGVIEGSAFQEILAARYPGIRMLGVERNLQGLRMVLSGELDGFVGGDASIAHALKANQISGITLVDQLHDNWDLSIAVSKQGSPYLLSAINKSLQSITPEERDQIYRSWMGVEYKHSVDYTLIWVILGGAGILAAYGLYRYLNVLSYNKMLRTIAEKDALTGILSRHKLCAEIDSFIELAQRHNWTLSLLFFDIDDFKQINDRFGHAKGDEVLIELCELIAKSSRKTDRFGRWGGEEFLFLMLETNLDAARMIAEKFRAEVEEHDFGLDLPVTCSFGVAQFSPGETVEKWVGRADEGLYQAKAEGKNCVRLS
ncbi:ABC transporter substrate-binding protein [Neptuniibacter halophilus]|uniref:ABC transporter substrate-binding protein n=1 Tax=Neptuniibacter halophilus TaxID=651666 RepID=UPI002573ABEC|nr:ABC transporter substrate-binding protein [Neptuniibacter halophilus]